jgi:hypothetical protein
MSMATTCGLGECAATGQTTCVSGSEGDTCTPGTPGAEVCDQGNLDEDCDGQANEGKAVIVLRVIPVQQPAAQVNAQQRE